MAMAEAGSKLKGLAGKAKKKVSGLVNGQKLEKAKLFVYNPTGTTALPIEVQFNPSEYHISRGLILSDKHVIGRDSTPDDEQVSAGDNATLNLSLYFDTITDLHSIALKGLKSEYTTKGVKGMAKDQLWRTSNDKPAIVCDQIMTLIKYAHDQHTPPKVRFVWGKLDFDGKIISSQISYTMFAPDGTPVRAKLDLTLKGEEKMFVQKSAARPLESPDRTKERVLLGEDQLWMMANEEYDDPAKWKVIAQANGILNPRKLEEAVTLKVPSIK